MKMNRMQLIEILKNTNTKKESSSLDEMIKNELTCWGEISTDVERW